MENEVYQKLLNKAFKILSIRPHSIKDLRKKLARTPAVSSLVVDRVIQQLEHIGLVNDREFAQWLIHARQGKNPKGKIVIKHELIFFGVERSIIEEELASQYSEHNEKILARQIAMKKIPRYKHLPYQERSTKIAQLLYRRGFNQSTIRSIIDEVC